MMGASKTRSALLVLVGVACGLLAVQGVVAWQVSRALPHLNILQSDPDLGVRLTPGATQRLKVSGAPTATVSINAQGWRGRDITEAGGVVVVGDAQVFGFGVDDGLTTPAQLAALINGPVINGGVPTYGPEEYLRVIETLAVTQEPQTIVVVLSFADDLAELGQPNTDRHEVVDGVAVRIAEAPADPLLTAMAARKGASPFADFLTRAALLAETHGAQLIVVALPGDTQLSAAARLGDAPTVPELIESRVLLDDLVQTAEDMGTRAFSAVQPLEAAHPGAAMDAEGNLTPRGHRALAAAIAEVIAAPLFRP